MKKTIIVGATLLVTVVAAKRKIARLQNQIDVLNTETANMDVKLSEVDAEIADKHIIKPEWIEADPEFYKRITDRSANHSGFSTVVDSEGSRTYLIKPDGTEILMQEIKADK